MERSAAITGWGMALPRRVVTNDDLAHLVETSDEWIRSRTGIATRYIADADEYTSVLASRAGQQALERSGIDPASIDLVILATCTPDRPFPATACAVQTRLGLSRAGAFDLVAACSGFVYGLSVASNLIRSGAHQAILLVATDLFSHILNWQDRTTCVLFGDGAGAVVLQAHHSDQPVGMLSSVLGAAGSEESLMLMELGGTRVPLQPDLWDDERRFFAMNGREVYRQAIREMAASSQQALEQAGLRMHDVDVLIPHQANARIVEALAKRLEFPLEQIFTNVERYGNTSAASVAIALCEAAEQGWLHPGSTVLLTSFGGGFTWASAVLRWGAGRAQ